MANHPPGSGTYSDPNVTSPDAVVLALEGAEYPARKEYLLHFAADRGVKAEVLWVLQKIADQSFASEAALLDEVRRVY